MPRTTAIWMLVLGACGRAGFATHPPVDDPDDGAMPDTPLDDTAAAQRLPCDGTVPRFTISGTSDASELSAIGTDRGYDVFVVEAGAARGFSFSVMNSLLTPGVSDVAIQRSAGIPADVSDGYRFGPLAVGDNILIAAPYGRPAPTGTVLISLDAQLGTRASAMYDGWFATHGALASSIGGGLAFLTQSLDSEQVDAMLVSSEGTKTRGPYPVLLGDALPNDPTILPAKTGYVVAWSTRTTSPNQLVAEHLDEELAVTSPEPIPLSTGLHDVIQPRGAYLAETDNYLFAWYQKTEGPAGDEVWISLRTGRDLVAVGPSIMISGASKATSPMVVAGRDDFLVVWRIGDAGLGAARVTTSGEVSYPVVRTSGQVAAYDAVVRRGQPAVVWLETGGSGPNLWFDPLCTD